MKAKVEFECVECGYQSLKYFGKCPQCQAWNSLVEVPPEGGNGDGEIGESATPVALNEIDQLEIERENTGLDEFDRVLGGGIVPTSLILIGGEPGVGKSTLLLGISGILAAKGKKILYYSGEESPIQIKLRANRLKINSERISLVTMGSIQQLKQVVAENKPDYMIVDSIQTIQGKGGLTQSGSIGAMKHVTAELMELAKKNKLTVFLIGHINKEGQIAGPKTLEHMVDVVLYFQGELRSDLRILRAEKNRFGPVNEIGVFQMTGLGLAPVADPSLLFIQRHKHSESGIAIFPAMNGLRAILIEIQALVSESPFIGNPRRIAVGFDSYRMSMLISVIEKKLKLPFYKSDVFLNVTGGMMIRETSADLAVITTLISSHKNLSLPTDVAILGEVGLTGEIRPVTFLENRMKEAVRQGFKRFIIPADQAGTAPAKDVQVTPVENLYDFLNWMKHLPPRQRKQE